MKNCKYWLINVSQIPQNFMGFLSLRITQRLGGYLDGIKILEDKKIGRSTKTKIKAITKELSSSVKEGGVGGGGLTHLKSFIYPPPKRIQSASSSILLLLL